MEFDNYMKENNFRCYYNSGTDASYINNDLLEYIFANSVLNDVFEFPNGYNFI